MKVGFALVLAVVLATAPTLAGAVALVPAPAVRLTEIMYDPLGADVGREWLEVTNSGSNPVDLSSWRLFEGGVNHPLRSASLNTGQSLPGEIPALLGPGEAAVIVADPIKFLADWPGFTGQIWASSFSLSNSGETIILRDALLTDVDALTYDPNLGAAGNGRSLQLIIDSSKDVSVWAAFRPTPGRLGPFDQATVWPAGEVSPAAWLLESTPPDGAIDARQPVEPDGLTPGGWSSVALTLSGSLSVAPLPEHFAIKIFPPRVDEVAVISATTTATSTLEIVFSQSLPAGERWLLRHLPSSTKICLGFLPGDVDADGLVTGRDLLALAEIVNQPKLETVIHSSDLNRDGDVTVADLSRLIELMRGEAHEVGWFGRSLPTCVG